MLRRKFEALELRLSRFQSLTKPAATQIQADSKSIETALEVMSSYLSIYLSIDPALVALIPFVACSSLWVLVCSGGVLGGLGAAFGGVLGRSWKGLGRPWGDLGGSLERSWGDLYVAFGTV